MLSWFELVGVCLGIAASIARSLTALYSLVFTTSYRVVFRLFNGGGTTRRLEQRVQTKCSGRLYF